MTLSSKAAEPVDDTEKMNALKAILALLHYAAQRAGEIGEEGSQAAIVSAAAQVSRDMDASLESSVTAPEVNG